LLKPGTSTILAEGHWGDWFDGLGGLSVYLPPPQKQRIAPDYASLAFARDAGWQKLLAVYHEAAV
jgi:hypothetical protein